MANLLGVLLLGLVWLVALIICFREKIWFAAWGSKSAIAFFLTVTIGLVCADILREKISLGRVIALILTTMLLAWPLVSASRWLGKASTLPVTGRRHDGPGRIFSECLGVAGGGLALGGLFVWVFAWKVKTGWTTPFTVYRQDSGSTTAAIIIFYLGFAAFEELIFRGVLLRWISWEARRWRHAVFMAVGLSSLLFGVVHSFEFFKLMLTLVTGAGFAWISIRHGLWAATLTHWGFNVAAGIVFHR